MTLRSFAILVVVTVVAVAAAIVSSTSQNQGAFPDRGKPLLPDLSRRLNDVSTIEVRRDNGITTIVRNDQSFVDASGFPVKAEAVRDLLASLSALSIVENKTDNPSRYADLNLAEPAAEDGAGTEIILSDSAGEEIARVVAGRNDYTVGGTSGGQYVRTGDSDDSYLVRGAVKLPLSRTSWFDTVLFEEDPEKLARIVHRKENGDLIEFRREGGSLAVVDPPANGDVDPYKVGRLTELFSKLDFLDVREATGSEATDRSLRAEIEDGPAITIFALTADDNGDQWVRISAESPREVAHKSTAELIQKVDGYEFRLPASDIDMMNWDVEDFLMKSQS